MSPDGPAAAAGIKIGDVLHAIDGRDVFRRPIKEFAHVITSGASGSTVELTLIRKVHGDSRTFTARVQRLEPSATATPPAPAATAFVQNVSVTSGTYQQQQPSSAAFMPLHPPYHHPASPVRLACAPSPPPPAAALRVSPAAPAKWTTGLMDVCSGGASMFLDALFCGSCIYFQLLDELSFTDVSEEFSTGEQSSLANFCWAFRIPGAWLNPFWSCCGHAQLRWRIAKRHNIPVRCSQFLPVAHVPHSAVPSALTLPPTGGPALRSYVRHHVLRHVRPHPGNEAGACAAIVYFPIIFLIYSETQQLLLFHS